MPLTGVLAAGMPPSSVQGCIYSVSWEWHLHTLLHGLFENSQEQNR